MALKPHRPRQLTFQPITEPPLRFRKGDKVYFTDPYGRIQEGIFLGNKRVPRKVLSINRLVKVETTSGPDKGKQQTIAKRLVQKKYTVSMVW